MSPSPAVGAASAPNAPPEPIALATNVAPSAAPASAGAAGLEPEGRAPEGGPPGRRDAPALAARGRFAARARALRLAPRRLARAARLGPATVTAAAVLIAVPVGRALVEGRAALAATDRALRAGDDASALASAREAAAWWLPGSPYAGGAFDRLRHVAHTAEAKGDASTAVGAWRALLASSARVRWPAGRFADHAVAARAALARLEPNDGPRPASKAPGDVAAVGAGEGRAGATAAAAALAGLVVFSAGAAAAVRATFERGGTLSWPLGVAAAGLALAAAAFGAG